jgi:hypothetical protein
MGRYPHCQPWRSFHFPLSISMICLNVFPSIELDSVANRLKCTIGREIYHASNAHMIYPEIDWLTWGVKSKWLDKFYSFLVDIILIPQQGLVTRKNVFHLISSYTFFSSWTNLTLHFTYRWRSAWNLCYNW